MSPKENRQIAHARSNAILVVFPNVYAAADHLGRLSAAVRYDPDHGKPGVVHFVGAEMQRTPREGLIRNELKERGVRQTMYDTTFKFSLTEQRIPHTDFNKRQIRDGSLIPANAETARLGGVKFVDPNTVLAQAKEKLIKELVSLYGEEVANEWSSKWPPYRICGERHPAESKQNAPVESVNEKADHAADKSDAPESAEEPAKVDG